MGGRNAFEECIRPYQPLLMGLARKLCRGGGVDAEDLVQDTLERALQHLGWLREQSPNRRQAWLCTTLQNRFLNLCRRQRTEPRGGLQTEELPAREPRSWALWEHLTDEEIQQAIQRLEQPLRAALELHLAGGRYKAIARQLGTTVGTVGYWLHEARRRLRGLLRSVAREREAAAPYSSAAWAAASLATGTRKGEHDT